MRINSIEAGTFGGCFGSGREQLYKLTIDGKTVEGTGPMSGLMTQLARRVLSGEDTTKVFMSVSRDYERQVMDVVNTAKSQVAAGA
jgi:hypothetical protein